MLTKTHKLSFTSCLNSKYVYTYERSKTSKNNKKQKKFEHKMASPAKRSKCRYDFVAFT